VTHYETLGVPPAASPAEIRDAYRALARRHHPDRGLARDDATMAAINEAYRVLGDPARRAVYDARLKEPTSVTVRSSPAASAPVPVQPPVAVQPARFPWKLALFMAAVGATVVLVGAALYEPGSDAPPDNVLQPGSCVVIEPNRDAREVNCTGAANELEVVSLVAVDERCPDGLAAYRDRQGLGMACVRLDP
jgi:molecular chaperone DnaJ